MRIFLLLLFVCLAGPLAGPEPVRAESADQLEAAIDRRKAEAGKARQRITSLTKQERSLYADLAKREDRVNALEQRIWAEEAELAEVRQQRAALTEEHGDILAEKTANEARLTELLQRLWPVYQGRLTAALGDVSSWSRANRRFTWMAALYDEAAHRSALLAEQTAALDANLTAQERTEQEIASRLAALQDKRRDMVSSKLELVKEIRKVRATRVSAERELSDVLSDLEALTYQLNMLTTRDFAALKGNMPWPTEGTVIASFAPSATPPVRGIGIATGAGQAVSAVGWGKVVHNDLLRGFGHVVIVFHGDSYYSLYAFMTESLVRVGQDVEKDEVIGHAGYYPKAEGPGIYFELRLGQKAVNPVAWLR